MNPPAPLPDRSDRHAASQTTADPTRQIAAPFAKAANADDFDGNPLWAITIAFACLFLILACLVASG